MAGSYKVGVDSVLKDVSTGSYGSFVVDYDSILYERFIRIIADCSQLERKPALRQLLNWAVGRREEPHIEGWLALSVRHRIHPFLAGVLSDVLAYDCTIKRLDRQRQSLVMSDQVDGYISS